MEETVVNPFSPASREEGKKVENVKIAATILMTIENNKLKNNVFLYASKQTQTQTKELEKNTHVTPLKLEMTE